MIAIRPARPEDAAAIAAIYAPYVLSGTVSFETDAPDARAMRARMSASDGLYPWLVATSGEGGDAPVVAYAYAGRFRDRPAYRYVVESSIYVAGAVRGNGVGRLLYEALIDTLRAQGFTQAIGVISLPNDGSISLHEAVGFRRAGVYREIGYKQGRWIDVGFWQCELNDSVVPPVEPKRFADIGVVRD
ncbi:MULTISPECIES: GNAT family N-acetyltransferase [Sphingomonas]|uniref:GNAT family N-acetyltransferase n=1 Tax=Sphingomonas lycopersici TaxID=2951807 RepID=A0AA41ZI72_9SPHN|nr:MULTISPECIES: GNAT family N-acetyltransferase [Sphingomonas]MCW6532449.1 GNAT family N-acetyltransferase [Sphingomonas lycopersici]MCW6536143.1 GNAT family N-acetyltransferase [Sphingomonas lycopersici]OJU16438.1 MAG: GNAT family N-acetyltransferase [Sphingomonas sp. 66-10]